MDKEQQKKKQIEVREKSQKQMFSTGTTYCTKMYENVPKKYMHTNKNITKEWRTDTK